MGIYGEASVRAGHTSTDFSSRDILGSVGDADYDSGSVYYGMHVGLGYIWSITDEASLDFSTKYIWTHQNSDSVSIQGETAKFKDTDSHRLRTGARFAYEINDIFKPYAGAYYEHEFDSKAKSKVQGMNIDAPDLKGGTGIGELGLTITPANTNNFAMDFALQGYTGMRRGVGGNVQMKFEF